MLRIVNFTRQQLRDLCFMAKSRDMSLGSYIRSRLEEADCMEISAQEGNEIMGEIAWGLAYAAGDDKPPHYRTLGCGTPHLGPKANRAIARSLVGIHRGRLAGSAREVWAMTIQAIDRAIAEARRFMDAADAARAKLKSDLRNASGCKETGAARRANLDLTRALADLRNARGLSK